MNRDIIRLDKYTFKFEDIDLIYPVYIRDKSGEKYYDLTKSLVYSNYYSRKYQLDHRSTQAQYFDLLLELDYFKLLNLNLNFILEFPLINTRPDIDPNRSYYLLDYFIPDLSLAIELDSDYHDPIKDKLKDQFLASIGIDVVRIDNFQINTKSKLESLVEYIREKKEVKFELSYEELIEEYKFYKLSCDDKRIVNGIQMRVLRSIEKILSYKPELIEGIMLGYTQELNITLDDLYNLIPMYEKKVKYYTYTKEGLLKLGVTLNILK